MSWRPFSKQPIPKQKAISAVIERDYEREVNKFDHLEESSKKLQKDVKKYTDSLLVMSKCEERLLSSLQSLTPILSQSPGTDHLGPTPAPLSHRASSFSRPASATRPTPTPSNREVMEAVERYSQIQYRTNSDTHSLVNTTNKVLAEPMKTWCSVYPNVHAVMKRRDACVNEVNKCQSKVEKYQDKERTGANLARLGQCKQALAKCKSEFDAENTLLMRELPNLYAQRVTYLQPSLSALTQAQMNFYADLNTCYQAVCNESQSISTSSNTSEGTVNLLADVSQHKVDDINRQLNDIKALSIVVDD